jgi:hypothetical protein
MALLTALRKEPKVQASVTGTSTTFEAASVTDTTNDSTAPSGAGAAARIDPR